MKTKEEQPKDIHQLLKEVVDIFGACTLLLEIKPNGSLNVIAVGGDNIAIESLIGMKQQAKLNSYVG